MKRVLTIGTLTLLANVVAGTVMAQSTPGTRPVAPAVTAPMPAAAPSVNSGTWMQQEAAGQWRASKIKGLNVYNGSNEKVGEIEELLVNSTGRIDAAVLSIGGFLGMGEHWVAVPFDQIQFTDRNRRPLATNSTPPTGTTTTPLKQTELNPERALVNMTKDQLKAAPQFHYTR